MLILTIVIKCAIILSFYVLGAYATTDILRLLNGSSLPISADKCYCPSCNNEIKLYDQIPIISYCINKGKCRNCKTSIPPYDLLMEILIFSILSLVTFMLNFSYHAYFFDIAIYEFIKIIMILIKGRRKDNFFRNLIFSILLNILLFMLVGTLFTFLKILHTYHN